jgi:hypothetical protein
MRRRTPRELRVYRRTRILRWAFLSLIVSLLGIQSVVSPMIAQASPRALPSADLEDENGMSFDGFKEQTSEKCVVVPYNVDGSKWFYYCRKKNDQDYRNWIIILKEDGYRQMGRYNKGSKGCPEDSGWTYFMGPYADLVEAQAKWAGTTDPVKKDYGSCNENGILDSLIHEDSRAVRPIRGNMSAQDWYGPKSFTAPTSAVNCDESRPMSCKDNQGDKYYKPADNPCAFFTKSVGKEERYVCRDPRVQTPCPKANLSGALLKDCATDMEEFYKLFSKNWKTEKQDPCANRPDGTSACDGGNTPGGAADEDVVSNLVNGVTDVKFTDDPIAWTKQEMSKASAEVLPWWILAEDPVIQSGDKYQTKQTVDFITRYTNVITYALVVLSVIAAGTRMVLQRDGAPGLEVARSMVTLVIVAALGVTVVNYLVRASAVFTNWFVIAGLNPDSHGQTGGQTPAEAVTQAVRGFTNSTGNMNFFVFLLAALFMIVGSIVQYFYMVVRFFLVIVLTGTLAMAAAATNTEHGKDWFRRHLAYLAAFILVKPASIIVFVSGARMWAPRYGADKVASGGEPVVNGTTMAHSSGPGASDMLSDTATRIHGSGSEGFMQTLSALNPLRGFNSLSMDVMAQAPSSHVSLAAETQGADMQMDLATQFRGLFVIMLITLLLPAMLRMVVPLVSPAAGSEGAGIALATGALTGAIKGAATVGSGGMAMATKGAQLTGSAMAKGHKSHQFKKGKTWSDQAKQDWSSNWSSNLTNNWDRTFQSEYQKQQGTFNSRLQTRLNASQSWDDAYQATYQETYQAAAASSWQKIYQDTYSQTWQQDEQRRNPGQPVGPAPSAPAVNPPVFAAAPTSATPPMQSPAAVPPPPPPPTPAPPGAAQMPDNP